MLSAQKIQLIIFKLKYDSKTKRKIYLFVFITNAIKQTQCGQKSSHVNSIYTTK